MEEALVGGASSIHFYSYYFERAQYRINGND